VGALVGACGALAYWGAAAVGLPPFVAGVLAVAATLLVTGALHEDGLADTADGFGAGVTRERKLEIMRDSRIGTYGVAALVLSILLRAGAVASLVEPVLAAPVHVGISEHTRMLQPSVDWKSLAGFRNVLVHDYLGVDLEYVYRAVEQDVPRLKRACESALQGLEHPG
jgi:adenosylcobinamide-GDP ribazoletransferase